MTRAEVCDLFRYAWAVTPEEGVSAASDEAWLVLADALEEAGARRLARRLRDATTRYTRMTRAQRYHRAYRSGAAEAWHLTMQAIARELNCYPWRFDEC